MTRHLFLLRELVRRDFEGRYAGSLFGFLWSFAHPLWQLALFYFVFSTVMKIPTWGERTDRFWVFLFAGMLPWLAVQEGVARGALAITDNAELVKKVRFPAGILVASVIVTGLVHEGIAAAVFAAILIVVGDLAWQQLPWLLAVLPVQIALTAGLALLLAPVNVFARDTSQVITMVLSAWFYMTPIVYPMGLVEANAGGLILDVLRLNPLTGIVEVYRKAFYGGAEATGWSSLVVPAFAAGVLLVAGWWLFSRTQDAFADEV